MKIRKKTLALLLFSVAFICSVGVSALVLWQTDVLNLPKRDTEPAASTEVQAKILYPAMDARGLWGYIDEHGSWQIPAGYQQANAFEGKAAWVQKGGLWGAIDSAGEFIVPPEYKHIELYADENNRFVAAFGSNQAASAVNSALYDINGQKLFGLAGELGRPSSGLMPFSRSKGGQTTWGYINPHGEIIIEPVYAEVGVPSGNYALVRDADGQTLLLNIYAKTGTVVENAAGLNAVGNRLVLVQRPSDGLFGYQDVDGNLQIDYSFTKAEAFRGGAALAAGPADAEDGEPQELFGLLTPDGVWAAGPAYQGGEYLGNGVYALKLAGAPGYSLLNSLGEPIVSGTVYGYDSWHNGLLACYTAEHTLFVNRSAELQQGMALPLMPGVFRLGNMFGVKDANGQSWFNDEGIAVYGEGRNRQLTEGVQLYTVLENANPAYMVYYPQIEYSREAASSNWRRLNTELAEQALGDYYDSYNAGGKLKFTMRGDFLLAAQGDILTAVQKLNLDDTWRAEDGQTEQIIHTVCFDKTNGRQYRFADLFADNVNWRTELLTPLHDAYSLACAAAAEEEKPEVLVTLQKRLPRNVEFLPAGDAVTLYFALSDGTVAEVPLYYGDIEDLLDKEGALWQALFGAE